MWSHNPLRMQEWLMESGSDAKDVQMQCSNNSQVHCLTPTNFPVFPKFMTASCPCNQIHECCSCQPIWNMCSAETTILQQLVLLVPSSFSTDPMCFPVKMRNTLRVNLSTRTTRTRKLKDVDISPDRTGQKECEKTSASWISGFSYEQRVHTLTCFSSILMLIQSNMKQDLSSCATMPVGYVEYRDKVWQECVHHVNSPSSWKMVMSEKWKWMEF